jgi:hypothetical protein
MGGAGLSDEVERFLVQFVPTVGHLEAILLMRRDAGRTWTVTQLAESLFVDKKKAAVIASHLSEHGFVRDDGTGTLWYAAPTTLARAVALADSATEGRPIFFLGRLVAYLLIVAAIVQKNFSKRG